MLDTKHPSARTQYVPVREFNLKFSKIWSWINIRIRRSERYLSFSSSRVYVTRYGLLKFHSIVIVISWFWLICWPYNKKYCWSSNVDRNSIIVLKFYSRLKLIPTFEFHQKREINILYIQKKATSTIDDLFYVYIVQYVLFKYF